MAQVISPKTARTIGLSLVLLCLACLVPKGAAAQEQEFNPDTPIASLQEADLDSEKALVNMATQLQKARADTEIRFSEYRKGVLFFRENHPEFYGNFFGDPLYASYDRQYQRLVQEAQLASVEVNPQNRYGDNTSFLCSPYGYDPAFGGWCRTFSYAESDFFIQPFFFKQFGGQESSPSADDRTLAYRGPSDQGDRTTDSERRDDAQNSCEDVRSCEERADSGSGEERPSRADRAMDTRSVGELLENARGVEPARPDIRPDDLSPENIETRSSADRIGAERLRPGLSPEERAELARRLGETRTISVEREDNVRIRREDHRARARTRDVEIGENDRRSSSTRDGRDAHDGFQQRDLPGSLDVNRSSGGSSGGGGGSTESSSNDSGASQPTRTSDG